MKYIRTKDGKIYEVIEVTKVGSYEFQQSIYKQADTIEELLDEVVVDDKTSKNCKPFIYYKDWKNILNSKVGKALDVCVRNGAIYGAIWTDKGLIYIAKMNDKGELELL